MEERKKQPCQAAALLYVLMVALGILADALPVGGVTTEQTWARYPALFTPAAGTFMIWPVIEALLLLYTLYQLGVFQWGQGRGACATPLTQRIAPWYCLCSAANMLWVVAWHYHFLLVSLVLEGILLYGLTRVMLLLRGERLCLRERLFAFLPFSVWFGWALVTVMANAAMLIVSLGWAGAGISPETWTIVLLAAGAGLSSFLVFRLESPAVGFVFLWAYTGILVQHTSFSGWDGMYQGVITAVIACLAAILAALVVFLYRRKGT